MCYLDGINKCKTCHITFFFCPDISGTRRLYCSDECRTTWIEFKYPKKSKMFKCIICNNYFYNDQKSGQPRKCCSDKCDVLRRQNWPSQLVKKNKSLQERKNKQCQMCEIIFDATNLRQKFCSTKCASRFNNNFKGAKGSKIRCVRCSKLFVNGNGRAKYCSRTCRRAGTHSDYRTRARRWNVEYDGSVTIAALIARFGRYCAECNELILGEHSSKANQDGPSIDHVVPMSAGGGHVWSNVELVHLRCNVKRWNAYRKVLSDASQ